MIVRPLLRAAGALVFAASTGAAFADDTKPVAPTEAASLGEAISGGKLLLNLRPRYEYVEQDGKAQEAHAITLRSLIGWQTQPYYGLSLTAEAISVAHLWDEEFNDTKNKKTAYPTVADPENVDFNQLFLDYTGLADTRLRLGKRSIKLDNVRFLGNVEFRQVMQVFTGVSVDNHSLPGVELYAGHFWRLKNIFAQQHSIRLEVAHADWTWRPGNHLVGYGYFLEQAHTVSTTGLPDNSNRSLGVRADGALPIGGEWKLLYTAEYAKQDDYADGDQRIDADYNRLGVGAKWKEFYARVDYEKLGSNDNLYAFQTPLGTNHLFQGWADQFLTTPKQGIEDTYVSAGAPIGPVKLWGEVHWLKADVGDIDWGTEFDLALSMPLRKGLIGKLEFAQFNEGDVVPANRKRDTTKLWITLQYNWE